MYPTSDHRIQCPWIQPPGHEPFDFTDFCWFYAMVPSAHYTLTHDFDRYPEFGKRIITLREGESFSLQGIIGEIDQVSNNCGNPPFFIPYWLLDDQGCVGAFNETFTYDDFSDGGGIGSSSAAFTEDTCDFDFQYSLTVQ
jgi:hypothetical protein